MNDAEIKNAVRKVWDRSSKTFDSNPHHRIGTPEEKDAWTRELNRDLPASPQRVLDVGCGTGTIGLLFAEMGHQVTGIDLSGEMLAEARKKAEASKLTLGLRAGDAEHLPFGDESFDVIISRHLLWTLPHPEIAVKDWHRVLVPGGTLLIIDGVWDDKRLSTRAMMRISSAMTRIFDPGNASGKSYDRSLRNQLPHDGGVPQETMMAWLERAGFFNMQFRDLMYIHELQKLHLPWYKRFAAGRSYYIIVSIKPDKNELIGSGNKESAPMSF